MSLQPNEVLIILFVALIVLGPKRLPGAIRSIGSAFRQVREFSTTVRQEMDATLSPPKIESDPPVAPKGDAGASETPIRSAAAASDLDVKASETPAPHTADAADPLGPTGRSNSDGTA